MITSDLLVIRAFYDSTNETEVENHSPTSALLTCPFGCLGVIPSWGWNDKDTRTSMGLAAKSTPILTLNHTTPI